MLVLQFQHSLFLRFERRPNIAFASLIDLSGISEGCGDFVGFLPYFRAQTSDIACRCLIIGVILAQARRDILLLRFRP